MPKPNSVLNLNTVTLNGAEIEDYSVYNEQQIQLKNGDYLAGRRDAFNEMINIISNERIRWGNIPPTESITMHTCYLSLLNIIESRLEEI